MLAGFINQSLKLLFVDVHNASSLLEFFTAMNTIAIAEVIRMAGKRLAIDAEQMLQHVTEAIINVRLILVRIGVARDPRLFTILPETPRPFFVDHWVPPRTESSCFQAFLLELFSTTGITISSSVKRSFLFCKFRLYFDNFFLASLTSCFIFSHNLSGPENCYAGERMQRNFTQWRAVLRIGPNLFRIVLIVFHHNFIISLQNTMDRFMPIESRPAFCIFTELQTILSNLQRLFVSWQ